MVNARQAAIKILMKIQRQGAYSNIALDSMLRESEMDCLDSAFLTALVYTSVEHLKTIDYNLSQTLSQSINKLKPEVLAVLRLGAAQLLFMDKIPSSAAVNESVKLIKKNKCSYAAGLVNAVLRKISAQGILLPESNNDSVEYLSIKYSISPWIIKLWFEMFGKDETEQILISSFSRKHSDIRVNTIKTTSDELLKSFNENNIFAEKGELANQLSVKDAGALDKLSEFNNGLFHVQDKASQLCCKALRAKPGERVLDICAAPGGKSFTIAQYMENCGEILSLDLYPHRVKLIENGAKRLGISIIRTDVNDASVYNKNIGMFDKILCDVPCSGLGVIAKKPDIRYKDKSDVDKLPEIQYNILNSASGYLKKNGRLIYSTCTLNTAENENICNLFLKNNPSFKAVPVFDSNISELTSITLLPHKNNSDGFFIAAFERTE